MTETSTPETRRRRPARVQLVVAAVIAVAAAVELSRLIAAHAAPGLYVGWAAAVLGAAATAWAVWPGLALAAAAPLLMGALGWNPIVEWSIGVFLVFSVTVRRGRPVLAGLLVAVPAVAGILLGAVGEDRFTGAFAALIAVAAAGGIGMAVRAQRRLRAALEQRAADAQATKDAEAERRVAEERLRIARDLHDVVGHEIAALSMQLGMAEVALPEDGAEQSRRALTDARASIRGVLEQTQRILAVLRDDSSAPGSAPTPGLAQLPALIASVREAGLDLDAHLDLPATPLAPETETAAYRVVQEALTNASRYARGTTALSVGVAEGELVIRTGNRRDPGDAGTAGDAARGSGLGLVGMRERVTAAGGTLEVESGGVAFALTARLPLERETAR